MYKPEAVLNGNPSLSENVSVMIKESKN